MPDELSPRQAAERIGATTRTVQRWIADGRLPATRIGGRWRVATDAIDAFSETNKAGDEGARTIRHPIRRLFIANRGEIATRIRRTCDRLGIVAVAPITDGPDALDLLDIDAVVSAARRVDADALHPGFGFLAENADFAAAVSAAGIAWVGPPPAAIRAMGDKAAARRLAASLDIPILRGYDDEDQSDGALSAAAASIGYPVLIKPSAGGGGKGMRIVRDPDRLIDALAGARREARSAFGDDRLILERLVESARHIEIQVLFDQLGAGIQLGERDCSIQRRHQKLLEETPSPAIDDALRGRLGRAALTLASAVGYVGAGTCEFLVDDRDEPTFLEMNTRLQVEHPVTELVTGRDLVADQLAIASGEPIAPMRDDRPGGHAIEVRLYAEDAEDGFLPATGRIEVLRWPSGDGIRVDPGIESGTAIGDRFDPMLAKIVAWAHDRPTALARLTAALDETVVLGIVTNLRFLRWLIRQPVVIDGVARTDSLDRIWPPDDWMDRTAIPEEVWGQAATAFMAQRGASAGWDGGWRLNAAPVVRLSADGQDRTVVAPPTGGRPAVAAVRVGETVHLDFAGRDVAFRLAASPEIDDRARTAATHPGVGLGRADAVAPMPGAVLAIHTTIGARVERGDPVITLEAMKMEHIVSAPSSGRIVELAVKPGEQVARRQVLATIEP
jgi:excisionase family DNA binding protein